MGKKDDRLTQDAINSLVEEFSERDLADLVEPYREIGKKEIRTSPNKPVESRIADHWLEFCDLRHTASKFEIRTGEVLLILEKQGIL